MAENKHCFYCDGSDVLIDNAEAKMGKSSANVIEFGIIADAEKPILYASLANEILLNEKDTKKLGRNFVRDYIANVDVPINYCPFCGRKLKKE